MFEILALATSLVASTVLVHFEGLNLLSLAFNGGRTKGRAYVLIAIYAILALHMVEIALWAAGYWVGDVVINAGEFRSAHVMGRIDYFYFSIEAYSSLGLGDVLSAGDLRLLARVETMTGLMMLAWSGSFTYLAMTQNWGGR